MKIALGSFLAAFGALGVVLPVMLGWIAPRPWSFALAFAAGLSAGLGAALALAGMIEHKRRSKRLSGYSLRLTHRA